MFDALDTEKTGVLTRENLQKGMKDHLNPIYLEQINWDKFMDSIDTKKNGWIDVHQLITATNYYLLTLSKDNIQKVFKILDKNNSGKLSKDDLHQIFTDKTKSEFNWDKLWPKILKEANAHSD